MARRASLAGARRAASAAGGYWTVIIPPAPYAQATEWHDTSGRAATLSRGAFATKSEATTWAKEHLRGAPYSLRKIGAGGKARKNAGAPRCPRCGSPMRRAVTGTGWFCVRKRCGEFKSAAGGKRRVGLIAAARALKQAWR